ncbi:MAG: 4Fe-4S dicluster domain-containing protein, partial [Planctomycetota bacterium]
VDEEPLVAAEGRLPVDLVLIRSGFARVSRARGAGHETMAYLGKGQIFGLAEIAHNILWRKVSDPPVSLQRSIRAIGYLDTLHIPIETLANHVIPFVRREDLPSLQDALPDANPGLLHSIGSLPVLHPQTSDVSSNDASSANAGGDIADRRQSDGKPPGPAYVEQTDTPLPTGLLEELVQRRLINGRQAMVIDLHRCTRCDDCVRACATTHGGDPRFARIGHSSMRLQFVNACMHCTDPICMIGCPTGAIARSTDGTVRIHEPICIGCGTCAASCPYESIQMVQVRQQQSGLPLVDDGTGAAIVKATKCDLCTTQPAGPACVSACPHDALGRVNLSETEETRQWLTQQTSTRW